MQYTLSAEREAALREYIERRQTQPHFANARSIRNALDRARLRQASRLFAQRDARSAQQRPDDDRSRRHPRQPRVRASAARRSSDS